MAWALKFDGVNDYLTFTTPVGNGAAVASDNAQHWELVITQDLLKASNYVYRPIESTVESRVEVLFRVSDGLVRYTCPISGQYQWTGVGLANAVDQELKFLKPLGVNGLDLYINGTFFASGTGGNNAITFDVYGKNSGAGYVSGNLTKLKFTDFITPANNRDFDPTASSHAAGTPILTDTIGGNNATGVNMPTDGSAWVDLGGSGVTVTVTEILNSFVDASNVNVDYNVSLLVTESFKQFTDSSIVSIESAESVTLSVTESFNKFIDSSSVNTSKQVSLAVTEILKSFEDGSNISIAKDVSVQVTEIMASFTDNSSVRLPANWNNKPVAVTSYAVKTPTTTIWIDKG